ncbi:hypothetical protein ACIBTV_30390 [Micromonospora sp. NPDC049366]|uniref:hypothetical protein n=1 Tax=Micromonospora sp. NPDC049366 TaxID=3364271 RepID=UPI0037B9154E
MEAQLMVEDLRVQAARLYQARGLPKQRADCLAEAVQTVRQTDTALAREVDRAIKEHRRTCRRQGGLDRHAICASSVAQAVRFRLPPVDLPGTFGPEHLERAVPNVGVEALTEQDDNDVVPQPGGDAADPLEDAAPGEPELTSCGHSRNDFLCPDLLKQLPTGLARVVAVVEVSYDATRFGFTWVTEDGELSTGADSAVNVHDAWLQAVCRTALDLGGELSNVQVVCRDERAASVVRYIDRVRLVPDALGFPVGSRTRELLNALVRQRGKFFVHADGCSGPHRGMTAGHRLATVVLTAAHEPDGAAMVKDAADRISEELRALTALGSAHPRHGDSASWVPGGFDADELRWQVALQRVHINGGWSILPDGLKTVPQDRQRLRVVVEHPGQEAQAKRADPVCQGELRPAARSKSR